MVKVNSNLCCASAEEAILLLDRPSLSLPVYGADRLTLGIMMRKVY